MVRPYPRVEFYDPQWPLSPLQKQNFFSVSAGGIVRRVSVFRHILEIFSAESVNNFFLRRLSFIFYNFSCFSLWRSGLSSHFYLGSSRNSFSLSEQFVLFLGRTNYRHSVFFDLAGFARQEIGRASCREKCRSR